MNEVSPVIVVESSRNLKIGEGEASATYAPMKTCPKDCVFLNNGCYAQTGYCDISTRAMNEAAEAYTVAEIMREEAKGITRLTGTKPLRLHVAGDCPDGESAEILAAECAIYSISNDMPVWTYTHNGKRIDRESWGGISVLASCETTKDVGEALERGYAASIVSTYYQKKAGGVSYIKCPAQFGNKTCVTCKICFSDEALRRTSKVVFFETHGHKRRASNAIYSRQQLTLVRE